MREEASVPKRTARVVAPELIGHEDVAGGRTAYVKIDLGIAGRPAETALFAPSYLKPSKHLDVILYLHGHDIEDGVRDIKGYLAATYGRLRQGLVSGLTDAVLIAPTLGPLSQAGDLTVGKRLDGYLDAAMAGLREHVFPARAAAPGLGRLLLACHSGGGAPMKQLALGASASLASLAECWGYDCLYHDADVPDWAGWAGSHADRRLRLFYLENGTQVAKRCHRLREKALGNVLVKASSTSQHMAVPLTHWRECLADAGIPKGPTRTADAS